MVFLPSPTNSLLSPNLPSSSLWNPQFDTISTYSLSFLHNFTCVVLSLWYQIMVTKNGSIPIWTTQSSHAQSVAPTTSTKKATTSVVQEHQSPCSIAW
jgi:hypothetical protein